MLYQSIISLAAMWSSFSIAQTGQPVDHVLPRPIRCQEGVAKIYKKSSPNDFLDIMLVADPVGTARDQIGIISVKEDGVFRRFAAVRIKVRGNSRKERCVAKPFRVEFLNHKINEAIQEILERTDDESRLADHDRLMRAYQILNGKEYGLSQLAFSENQVQGPRSGPFSHLGDDIKVVTHCGDPRGGSYEQDHDRRLLREYFIYEALARTGFVIENVRLAQIRYFDSEGRALYVTDAKGNSEHDGNAVLGRPAFFREPPRHLARRCGLKTRPPTQAIPPTIPLRSDELSRFELEFLNELIGNQDYFLDSPHNVNVLYDDQGRRFFSPYDFDLAYSVYSNPVSYPVGLQTYSDFNFKRWLKEKLKIPGALESLSQVVDRTDAILAVIKSADLDKDSKRSLHDWLSRRLKVVDEIVTPFMQFKYGWSGQEPVEPLAWPGEIR